ncbi:MAG: 30S ribosomal protein S9 [Calditrichaeota bacterium]|nr:30S ribosomal protein S9 [Calditrichota bacterium]MCB9366387.1 30S ribosomal protein S9 [Calditrichota bacterium]MCB9391983.1 30S ribosomal protein S9 [Calditrichota bacterium]
MKDSRIYATGRRKTAIARVWLAPGSGKVTVNGKDVLGYFKRDVLRMLIERPLTVTETMGKVDIKATVRGGGKSGQAGAFRLGISRALTVLDEAHRPVLRQNDLLTRDPREKERKKYGKPGARKSFQFSKR